MRVTKRVRRNERGAVLILVAVFALVAVGFMAFVIDIGSQRQDRRQLTTATDASALAVAGEWADNGLVPLPDFTLISTGLYDCTQDAREYLDENREVEPGDYSCRAEIKSGRLASVSVFADGQTNYQVGPAIGVDSGSIGSTTSVRITASPVGGLRPYALCAAQDKVNEWYTSEDALDPDTVTRVEVKADKFLPEKCGKNNGNWGFVQFESQGPGKKTLADTIKEGSDDEVAAYSDPGGAHRDRCDKDYDEQWADHGEVTCIFQDTGSGGWNNNNAMLAFKHLIGPPAITFSLPVYDQIVDLKKGSATGFPVVAFAEVRLVSYVQGGAKDNSVTLDFIQKSTVPFGQITATNHILEICDVGTTGGAQLASFDTTCHAAVSGGGTPPPVDESEPCVVNSVTPGTQLVTVSAGTNVNLVSVDVTVADAGDCPGLTAAATRGGTAIDLPDVTQSGNIYSFSTDPGAPFGSPGLEYVVEASQGGSVRHDLARMTTAPPGNDPPTASFTGTCSGLTCDFTDASTDSDGTIASRLWDFGDGTTSTAQNPTKTYATAGSWTVTLTVTDDDGANSVASGTANPTALTISVTSCPNNSEGCSFTVTGGPVGGTYSWSYPGGSPGTGNPKTITFPVPSAPDGKATYQVTVTVTPGGQTATVSVECARSGGSGNATCAKA